MEHHQLQKKIVINQPKRIKDEPVNLTSVTLVVYDRHTENSKEIGCATLDYATLG